MIANTLDELKRYLEERGMEAALQADTQQLHSTLKIAGFEYPFFVRPYENSPLLQLLVFLPSQIKKGCEPNTARLLHLINKEMDIPGFGMDETNAVLFYRMMLFAIDQQIDELQIGLFLDSLDKILRAFTLPAMAVAQGRVSYDDIVKQLKSNQA